MNRPTTFDARLVAHLPFLRRLANRFVPRPQRREEIVQETVARALEKWASFREDGAFRAWLRFIFWNVNNPERPEMKMELRTLGKSDNAFAVLATGPAQEDAVELSEALARLGALSPEDRSIIIADAIGNSQAEIAAMEGITRQAVNNRVRRARNTLFGLPRRAVKRETA